jgi:stringent starvation protein B
VKESPTTPYLVRAIHEWCCDNGLTPYIAVRVDESTRVPMEHVKNGEIVLNVSPDATRNLTIGNDFVQFSARFSGVSREISVPIGTIAGVFAKETGQGLAFQVPEPGQDAGGDTGGKSPTAGKGDDGPQPSGGRARLQVVK